MFIKLGNWAPFLVRVALLILTLIGSASITSAASSHIDLAEERRRKRPSPPSQTGQNVYAYELFEEEPLTEDAKKKLTKASTLRHKVKPLAGGKPVPSKLPGLYRAQALVSSALPKGPISPRHFLHHVYPFRFLNPGWVSSYLEKLNANMSVFSPEQLDVFVGVYRTLDKPLKVEELQRRISMTKDLAALGVEQQRHLPNSLYDVLTDEKAFRAFQDLSVHLSGNPSSLQVHVASFSQHLLTASTRPLSESSEAFRVKGFQALLEVMERLRMPKPSKVTTIVKFGDLVLDLTREGQRGVFIRGNRAFQNEEAILSVFKTTFTHLQHLGEQKTINVYVRELSSRVLGLDQDPKTRHLTRVRAGFKKEQNILKAFKMLLPMMAKLENPSTPLTLYIQNFLETALGQTQSGGLVLEGFKKEKNIVEAIKLALDPNYTQWINDESAQLQFSLIVNKALGVQEFEGKGLTKAKHILEVYKQVLPIMEKNKWNPRIALMANRILGVKSYYGHGFLDETMILEAYELLLAHMDRASLGNALKWHATHLTNRVMGVRTAAFGLQPAFTEPENILRAKRLLAPYLQKVEQDGLVRNLQRQLEALLVDKAAVRPQRVPGGQQQQHLGGPSFPHQGMQRRHELIPSQRTAVLRPNIPVQPQLPSQLPSQQELFAQYQSTTQLRKQRLPHPSAALFPSERHWHPGHQGGDLRRVEHIAVERPPREWRPPRGHPYSSGPRRRAASPKGPNFRRIVRR